MEQDIYTLEQLLGFVKEAIDANLPAPLWVKAEIQQLTRNRSGHCYLTLIEKSADGRTTVAEARAIIWSSQYTGIAARFEFETGRRIEDGIGVLCCVRVNYSPVYGFSLVINDIDPSFTVGEAFLQRQRTIARLQSEGMIGLNAQNPLTILPRRLALISSETAAGYGDFMDHLHGNAYGFKFSGELFAAPMQGSEAPAGIIAALSAIADRLEQFDAVLIMRGGGSASDLACFDDYNLALAIAQFPLPVFTAIGHERDVHVADMVAAEYLKTPTALADYFVDIFSGESLRLQNLSSRLSLAVRGKIAQSRLKTENTVMRLRAAVKEKAARQAQRISLLEYRVGAQNPAAILAKGFALTLKEGRRITGKSQLNGGDEITIMFADGTVKGQIL